ncbi:protein kinase [Teredinibacter turnerae T7901]|uniref:non-specific serine/threonine protein kinase n=1 Tax=Teredinibacter turnerae (strain ATCC 39867 / T7901) TaxID=377629 RepID=C5BPM4_TERTT|nr:serine/threonine-protein kinase [Teredinibacter turnerae]ACR13228.1 protein kinase [Teredinibacter turnerae T7901]
MAVTIPGYKILRTLGKGGMATVYLAQQEIFEREVALKIMSRALAEDESFGQRFFREAKIVSQLVHPNIVTVHNVGVHSGYYFLAMEYIDGGDLKQVRHNLSLQQKITTILDIAKALDYAASKGYVHRDIKPENIMFHNSDGRAVLMDFGIARAATLDKSVTQTGVAIGTPHYMSPEQAKGKSVDFRSDLYSLGVVFFLLLSGRVPFDAESAVAIGIKHITEAVPLLPPGMAALQPIVDTLMAKDARDRYQSAGDLIDDLQRIDVALVDQSVAFAHADGIEDDNRDLPTVQSATIENIDAISVVYDDRDPGTPSSSGVLPWLIGLVLTASLGGWLFYQQRPEVIQPWLDLAGEKFAALAEQPLRAAGADGISSRNGSNVTGDQGKTPAVVEPEALAEGAIERQKASASTTETSDKASPSPTPDPLEVAREKIVTLERLYRSDATYLDALVEANIDLLNLSPEDSVAEANLASLGKEGLADIERLLVAGKFSAAKQKLEQVEHVFAGYSLAGLDSTRKELERQQQISALLSQAQAYQEAGQLVRPSGKNAATSFKAVLRLDSTNLVAKNGLQAVAAELVSEAGALFKQGQLQSALAKTKSALDVIEGHSGAKTLQRRIERQVAYVREIDDYFRMAELRVRQGEFFQPENDNADYYYQRILRREPKNQRAKEGRDAMVDEFARAVWRQVGDEQFFAAQERVQTALAAMPENNRLQSLKLAVEEIVAEKSP